MMKRTLTEKSWIAQGKLPPDLILDDQKYMHLWNMRPGIKHTIKLFGKECMIPRQQMVYGVDNYRYSGTEFPSVPIPNCLRPYLEWANQLDDQSYDHLYNMILVNWYENGADYIGSHRDDEAQIIPHTDVMTISFGTERIFRIKYAPIKSASGNINDNAVPEKMDIPLVDNHYLVMGGHFQDEFKHEIPKQSTKKVKGSRISLTFRKFRQSVADLNQ